MIRLTTAVLLLSLTACASRAPVAPGEYTPGAESLFRAFDGCQTSVFKHVEQNRAQYESIGPLKATPLGGLWFDGKAVRDEGATVLKLDKPMKINGLTVVAIGYSLFKGDGSMFFDSNYWGFYFAEKPDAVRANLGSQSAYVARMFRMGTEHVNMTVRREGGKKIEQGGIIEGGNDVPGAQSFFNCSIQIQAAR